MGVKTYVYQSPPNDKDECCIAMIHLHSPLHRVLEARPPWDDYKFGQKQYQQHSDAAVTFHWLHTTSLTFRGVNKNGFETPKEMIGTILPAFALRMFELNRLHLGDSRVATWFGKTLLLGKNSGSSLEYKKCVNRFCRKHGDTATWYSNSLYIRIMNRISQAGPGSVMTDDDIAESVYEMLMKEKREEERKIYQILDILSRKYFKDESSIMAAIFGMHDKTWNPVIQGKKDAEKSTAAKREELREEARQEPTKETKEKSEAFLGGFGFDLAQ